MTETRPPEITIRTHADIRKLWTALLGSVPRKRRSIWLAFLDEDDRTLPVVVPIDDIPAEPDEQLAEHLQAISSGLIASGSCTSAMLLMSRPGSDVISRQDRRWAALLGKTFDIEPGDSPIYLATPHRLQPIAADAIAAAS